MSQRRLETEPVVYVSAQRRWQPINRGTFFSHGDDLLRHSPIRFGQRFNRLTAISVAYFREGKISWFCRCDCSMVKVIEQSQLILGTTKSCGCLRTDRKDFSVSVGDRFGRLTVIDGLGGRSRKWLCQCDCGSEPRAIFQFSLKSGESKSCGCFGIEQRRAATTTHGEHKSREYRIWYGMRQRCENPNEFAYKHYGGRGIKICGRWKIFTNFLADMGRSPPKMSIERVDNDGDYEPGNCVWATMKQQARNRRTTILVSLGGETMAMVDAAKALGILPQTIWKYRQIYGETPQQAVDRLAAQRRVK